MENCPALPEWNLISTCNCKVKFVPTGWVKISSWQTEIMKSPPKWKSTAHNRKKSILCLIILRVINLKNDKQICKENLSSSAENISTHNII